MKAMQTLTLANGCNPTTSFAQVFQHASSNDIHSHDEYLSTGCKSSLVNRVTSRLFSFVVEFANSFKMGGGGGGRKTVAPKLPRVVCLSHPCTFRHSSEGRQIRPAELGKQPEF